MVHGDWANTAMAIGLVFHHDPHGATHIKVHCGRSRYTIIIGKLLCYKAITIFYCDMNVMTTCGVVRNGRNNRLFFVTHHTGALDFEIPRKT
jgi:hypothetical protein